MDRHTSRRTDGRPDDKGIKLSPVVLVVGRCVSLVFYNRGERDILWREELNNLSKQYDWFVALLLVLLVTSSSDYDRDVEF